MLEKFFGELTRVQKKTFAVSLLSLSVTFLGCLFVLIVSLNFSFGWFSEVREAKQNGMQLTMQASGNLILSDSTAEIVKTALSSVNGGSPFAVSAYTDSNRYTPASHDGEYATYPTGLKYVVNSGQVDHATGIGANILYATAENGEDRRFYVDYTVYVAAHGKALPSATLRVSIACATKEVDGIPTEITEGSLMATSVDIYRNTTAAGNYVGTLNVAGLDAAVNDYPGSYNAAATRGELYLIGGPDTTGTIPRNTDGYLTYVLRFYFDGALQSGTNQTYIYTAALDCSKVALGIRFDAAEVEQ